MNIASLQAHINELKQLLAIVKKPFDIIEITETKLREDMDILGNISINGYKFESTPTSTFFGGAALYIRDNLHYRVRTDLSFSETNVGESIFIEITQVQRKNILVDAFIGTTRN